MSPSIHAVLAIAATAPALRRVSGAPARFCPAPRNPAHLSVGQGAVFALVSRGLLAWVNACRTAVVLTDEGRAELARIPRREE